MKANTHHSFRDPAELPQDYRETAERFYRDADQEYNCMGMADLIGALILLHEERLNGKWFPTL